MPKSTTRTPSGSGRLASRRTTSTPKASSPRKMLPMPAMRIRRALMRCSPAGEPGTSVPGGGLRGLTSPARLALFRWKRPQAAHRSVKAQELIASQGLGALEQSASPGVCGKHLLLLLVRHGQDAQGQDLVDLHGVEEVTGTLRSNLRIVVQ